jgi:hypothetical protein
MFPTGGPGIALLLLRVALAAMLLHDVLGALASRGSPWVILALAAVAIALCAGLLTPVMSAVYVVIEMTAWHLAGGGFVAIHASTILVAVALALLGPGAYSFDARLFGRRQVIFPSGGGAEDE